MNSLQYAGPGQVLFFRSQYPTAYFVHHVLINFYFVSSFSLKANQSAITVKPTESFQNSPIEHKPYIFRRSLCFESKTENKQDACKSTTELIYIYNDIMIYQSEWTGGISMNRTFIQNQLPI